MDELQQHISFRTDFFLVDSFNSKHAIKYFDIFPIHENWSFTILACFLNQLPNFKKNDCLPFKKCIDDDRYPCGRFSFVENDNPKMEIIVFVGNTIKVKCTRDFIVATFKPANFWFLSNLRSWNKIRTYAKYQQHVSYLLFFNRFSDGTKAFFYHRPLIFSALHDFSNILYFFIKSTQKVELPFVHDTFAIHEFFQMYFQNKQKVINTYEKFKENVNGYLKLTIQKFHIKKNLAKYREGGINYYIISGIYVSPFAQNLIKNYSDIINGCLLDTTWKCLPYYVTSILMLSVKNTGIPISFAFGNKENKELYRMHFTAFKELFDIDLDKFPFESDQGSSLISLFEEKQIKNFFCLRHLFTNLKFNEYAFAVENIVKCATQTEFDNAIIFYSELFSYTFDEQKIKKRDKALSKVGLVYKEGFILIENDSLWEKVSVLKRIPYKLPTTTNSLESYHGQLNSKTPRHNNFWSALHRIANNFILKFNCIQDHISHNYLCEKKKTIDHAIHMREDRMKNEIMFYDTNLDKCNCSENKLLSAIYEIDLPCAHQCFLGSLFPDCPKLNIKVEPSCKELIDKIDPLEDDETKIKFDIETQDKQYITSMIIRFGPCKKQEEVSKFVDENYIHVNDEQFINNKPTFILRLIHIGIQHFGELKELKKNKKSTEEEEGSIKK